MSAYILDTTSLYDKKEEIRCFIQNLLTEKGKDTNYVNKRMQDSIVNFFFEDYVAPLFTLSRNYDTSINRKQLHKNIVQRIKSRTLSQEDEVCKKGSKTSQKNPKYVQLLSEYLELLTQEGLIREYQQMLVKTILMDESEMKESCLTLLWRKQLCILLIEHSINPSLNNIYLMWNAAYPENPIFNKKESFYRKNLKQRKISQLQDVQCFNSSESTQKNYIQLQQQSSLEEESLQTQSYVKQEYRDAMSQMEQSASLSTELRTPTSYHNNCKVEYIPYKPIKLSYQKIAKVLSLNQSQMKCISFNFEIIQSINQQLSNQTYLSRSIIQLQ